VLVDGSRGSCITLAATVEGREITTIEGLMPAHIQAGGSGPDPVQAAFDKCGALQRGFCQPGMMLWRARPESQFVPEPRRDP
jgi:aerobic-type carbon monoxide dehydrogenase small subunit (CoxS/CutS family)